MKIRTQIQLNVNGTQVRSGEVVDIDDGEAKTYIANGLATAVGRGDDVTVETRTVEAPETADSPRTRRAPKPE